MSSRSYVAQQVADILSLGYYIEPKLHHTFVYDVYEGCVVMSDRL